MQLNRLPAPTGVQFEITERCNNRCFFCYNDLARTGGDELKTDEVKRILREMAELGVPFVNINGGEPLLRTDLLEIVSYACSLDIQLHMNSNGTLFDDAIAGALQPYVNGICTSLLAGTEKEHDRHAGRKGAFRDVLAGMECMARNGISVEVNVCTTSENVRSLREIARVAADHGCTAFCSTRYILTNPKDHHLVVDGPLLEVLLEELVAVPREIPHIQRCFLGGPVPFCEAPERFKSFIRDANIPCKIGYGTCRISATGKMTPCTISPVEVADLRKVSFEDAWNSPHFNRFVELSHLPQACRECDDLQSCAGGCALYDEALIDAGDTLTSKKWNYILAA